MAWQRVLITIGLVIELLGVYALFGWLFLRLDCREDRKLKTIALIALSMLLSVVFTAVSCWNYNARSPPLPRKEKEMEKDKENKTSEIAKGEEVRSVLVWK